jgi:alpha-beta hydrolase superfamily lysophospholipase
VHQQILSLFDAPLGGGRTFRNTPDPTDLLTLVVVPLAMLYLGRSARGVALASRGRWRILAPVMLVAAAAGAGMSQTLEPEVSVEPVVVADNPALHFLPRGAHLGTAVLGHGIPANKQTLFRLGEALAAAGFEAVAVDLPGNGASALPLSQGGEQALLAAARYLGNGSATADVVVGHSVGATYAGWAIARGELHARALLVFGALPELAPGVTRLWYFGGQLDELHSETTVRAWARRTGASVVMTPLADHPTAVFSPPLVEAAVAAACSVVGAPVPPPAGRWRWRLCGAVLLLAAALVAISGLARMSSTSRSAAAARGAACAGTAMLAAHLAAATWLVGVPTLRRAAAGLIFAAAAGLSSWLLALLVARILRRRPAAAGPWAVALLLGVGGIASVAAGAPFAALVGLLAAAIAAAGALLAWRMETSGPGKSVERAGAKVEVDGKASHASVAGHVAFALAVGWVLGMWCPLP